MHEHHLNREPDEMFVPGTFAYLVPGNEGRALDGRRTPGFVESYDAQSAMFVWRITAFEDRGKCWELPAETVNSYQFRKNSATLTDEAAGEIEQRCAELKKPLHIKAGLEQRQQTQAQIAVKEAEAAEWCQRHSRFFSDGGALRLDGAEGESSLYQDLEDYLTRCGVYDLEKKTAEQYLLNPYAGEWIKGMKIVMAEMGLIEYGGEGIRKQDSFLGRGAKQVRKDYIIARIAFVRSVFKLCGYQEVPLYRGVSSEGEFFEYPSTLMSMTFSMRTALAYADLESAVRNAYCVKHTCPVDFLFMTYAETKEFNERYKEQEAVVLYQKTIRF